MNTTLKIEGFFETNCGVGLGVLVAAGISDIDEPVVADFSAGAFVVTEKRAGLALAFDEVVFEAESAEVAPCVEPEKPFGARSRGGVGDDVIVADSEVVVGFVDPNDPTARILDEVVVEGGRTFCGCFPKA